MDKLKFGFHSKQAAELFGEVVYNQPDGKTVAVTCVADDPQNPTYMWEDTVPVGVVTNYIQRLGTGKWGKLHLF